MIKDSMVVTCEEMKRGQNEEIDINVCRCRERYRNCVVCLSR